MKRVCAERQLRLCLDCISSIGTMPVDVDGVFLASGVSGKGLGAYPGLSMVYHNHDIAPAAKGLPRYLDVGLYSVNSGVPFTHSSNLVYALRAALERLAERGDPFEPLRELSGLLRTELRHLGLPLIGADEMVSPAVITIALPPAVSSERFGRRFDEAGFLLSYRSGYLLKRNWVQICLMGECPREKVQALIEGLRELTPAFMPPSKAAA